MKQRIVEFIRKHSNRRKIQIKTSGNFFILVDLDDLIQRTIFYELEWEPQLTRFFQSNLNENDIFYDIGCNIGYYSLLAASKRCVVTSIDPDPNNIAAVKENARINNFMNISTQQFGLGEFNEKLMFYQATIGNNGLSGFYARNVDKSYMTNTYTLDHLIFDRKKQKPTILKLDTEGWEEKILKGSKKLLEYYPPRIIVFESESDLSISINNCNNIINFLKKYGYHIEKNLNDKFGSNYIALHKSNRFEHKSYD